MLDIVFKSFRDLFDKKIFFISLLPLIISALFWSGFFYLWHESIDLFFTYILSHIPYIGTSEWLKKGVEAVSGIFAYYQLVILTSMSIVGVIADRIVDRVNEKYYHLQKRGFGTTGGSIFVSLKQNLIFFILFIFTIPFMFIPVVNIILNLLLWSLLIKKPLFYDSIVMYATKDEYKTLFRSNQIQTKTLTLFGASLFLVPFLGVFVYVIQLLIFTHFNMQRLRDIRSN